MARPLSPNMEMYLKTIYRLQPEGEPVRVKDIAQALGVTMPSVSGALRNLRSRGLVLHPSYGAVRLSAGGRRSAAAVSNRFEVLQQFLTNVLGVDAPTAARDACEIEHVVSEDTLWRLMAFLDFTTRCRMDVSEMIAHFHEYLGWRRAGDYCRDCEVSGERPADCPMPRR